MRTYKAQAVLASLLWLTAAAGASAQGARPEARSEGVGSNCESNIAYLDAAHSEAGDDGLVIAVARLGDGERGRALNQRRLHNLRTYLEKFRKRAGETIVTAEGERVKGLGRVEVYVGGKLAVTLEPGRGQDLHAGSCSASSRQDTLFYDSRNPSGRGVYIPPNRGRP
jgi:hypothetical protein